MMSDLKEAKLALERVSDGVRPTPVLAAVSGGLDSMCLLHLLSTWGQERKLEVTAAHFNHGLRGAFADRDEAFVQEICTKWGIPCVVGHGDTRAVAEREGLSAEEAARKLRYAFLEEQQQEQKCVFILTAHHADDNAETMLLNLLRGTGSRGLTGIPASRDRIHRPFLRVTREELAAYAEKYDVPHIEDETNQELDAARNVLRQKVLPVLRELNPRAVENMARTADLLLQDEEMLSDWAERLVQKYVVLVDNHSAELPVEICREESRAIVSRVVLLVLARVAGCRQDLSYVHVEAAMKLLYDGRPGQEITLPYGMKAVRTSGSLVIRKESDMRLEETPVVPGQEYRFGDWQIVLGEHSLLQGERYHISLPECKTFTVSGWKSADRMTVPSSRGSRSVKRLAADRGLSFAERDRLPVLRMDGCPVVIPGIGVNEKFTPDENQGSILVTFIKKTEENKHEK